MVYNVIEHPVLTHQPETFASGRNHSPLSPRHYFFKKTFSFNESLSDRNDFPVGYPKAMTAMRRIDLRVLMASMTEFSDFISHASS
jgi:hypothetical protein